MTTVTWLLSVIAGLGVWGYIQYKQKQTAEALNSNLDTKEKSNDIEKNVVKNKGLIDAEKQKQADLQKQLEEEKAKDVSKDDLLNFFNNTPK